MLQQSMSNRRVGMYFIIACLLIVVSGGLLNLHRSNQRLIEDVAYHEEMSERYQTINAEYWYQLEENKGQLEIKQEQFNQLNARVLDLEQALGKSVASDDEPEREALLNERIEHLELDVLVQHALLQVIPNGSPLNYQRISSSYGSRKNPISGRKQLHRGIDLTCKIGESIIAPADGVVETVRPSKKGYGNFMTVRHGFGFMTSYAH
ncbi:M23 family metallopeptidase, partial [Vibrio jasicida]|uniref:M23 family metallopeptidase n=1 Tax=Vibrio jasicida TaxID=766224 RepID=UPI0005EF19B9